MRPENKPRTEQANLKNIKNKVEEENKEIHK
jgi:hypothetical protein